MANRRCGQIAEGKTRSSSRLPRWGRPDWIVGVAAGFWLMGIAACVVLEAWPGLILLIVAGIIAVRALQILVYRD